MIEFDEIGTDPKLNPDEKETTINAPNDTDTATICTEIQTHIKWVLSVEESDVLDHRTITEDGGTQSLVMVKARIPKGILMLKPTARKSDTNGDMTSYGPLTDHI